MRKQLVLAALLLAAPFAAPAAETLSYTYLEGGYAHLAQDDLPPWGGNLTYDVPGDPKTDGFFIGGSFAFSDDWYGFASYRRGTDTVEVQTFNVFMGGPPTLSQADVTGSRLNAGVGYRFGISDSTDLLAELSAYGTKFDVDGQSRGYGFDQGPDLRLSVGVRAAFGPMEAWAKAHYTDVTMDGDRDGPSEFSATGGLQYKFTQTLGIVGEYEGGDGYSQYTLGVRASF